MTRIFSAGIFIYCTRSLLVCSLMAMMRSALSQADFVLNQYIFRSRAGYNSGKRRKIRSCMVTTYLTPLGVLPAGSSALRPWYSCTSFLGRVYGIRKLLQKEDKSLPGDCITFTLGISKAWSNRLGPCNSGVYSRY
ncbi:hypothetical protein D9M68_768290 [compost metagenome]